MNSSTLPPGPIHRRILNWPVRCSTGNPERSLWITPRCEQTVAPFAIAARDAARSARIGH